jgi:tetrapyrrole methylase family protein/MazG family protein
MKEFDDLVEIVRVLRSPRGCPWDRAQKLSNYKKYLLEEAYELIDSIDDGRTDLVKEELGDLFLILIVISEFFKASKKFDVKDCLKSINSKLIVRHPHVFSTKELKTKEEVFKYWIKTKAKKKQRKTVRDRLPFSASALFIADIFFREYAHLCHKHGRKLKKEALLSIPNIIAKLQAFAKTKRKGKLLSEIIFAISRLASAYQIDLEAELRKKVFAEAEDVPYCSVGE